MSPTNAAVLDVRSLDDTARHEMFALFNRYFEATSNSVFQSDLDEKDSVILLRRQDGAICGFSTLVTFPFRFEGRDLRIVYSGDTIIDRAHWGSQSFAYAWIRHIGRTARQVPETPLYWLLIVKGHRTYRYLPAFGLKFVPDWRGGQDGDLVSLRNAVAIERFGSGFDPQTGLVRHHPRQDHLSPEYAAVTARERVRPDVAYFLACNPGYVQGDELVCLCELSPNNMRPLTRRLFEQGWRG